MFVITRSVVVVAVEVLVLVVEVRVLVVEVRVLVVEVRVLVVEVRVLVVEARLPPLSLLRLSFAGRLTGSVAEVAAATFWAGSVGVEALFVGLDPPHAANPIAASATPVTSVRCLPPPRAGLTGWPFSSSEASIVLELAHRRVGPEALPSGEIRRQT
jgi:hypothetical protein